MEIVALIWWTLLWAGVGYHVHASFLPWIKRFTSRQIDRLRPEPEIRERVIQRPVEKKVFSADLIDSELTDEQMADLIERLPMDDEDKRELRRMLRNANKD